MNTTNDGQLEKLLEDISSIKSVINKNRPLLQQILNPSHFRLFTFLAAVSVIGFTMLIYFLIQNYGSFRAVPAVTRYAIFAAIAVVWFLMQYFKRRIFIATGRRIDPTFTISRLLKDFFSFRIGHVYVPVMLLIVFLIVYFIYEKVPYYIVPAVSIGLGFLYNFIGSFTEIRHYLVVGYWFLITGVVFVIFNQIPVPISLTITLGCGLLIFSALGYFAARTNREE